MFTKMYLERQDKTDRKERLTEVQICFEDGIWLKCTEKKMAAKKYSRCEQSHLEGCKKLNMLPHEM